MNITHIACNPKVEAKQWFKDGDQPDMGEHKDCYSYPYNYLLNGGKCEECGYFMFEHAEFDNCNIRISICPSDWILVPPENEYGTDEPFVVPHYLFLQLYDKVRDK